jgi:hypothetical protein
MTHEDAKKLKRGQYIQVNIRGEWVDALFIFYEKLIGISAYYMGILRATNIASSIYGSCSYFSLDEVKIPKGSDKK